MAPLADTLEAKKRRTRQDYPFHLEYRTRWSDNDMYGHLNNSIYAFLFDSIINTFLITYCGLDPYNRNTNNNDKNTPQPLSDLDSQSTQIGLVVSSYCDYFASVSFPDVLDLGLRVTKLGSSSVTYEVGVFKCGEESVKAVGGFTHVFVERGTMRPEKRKGMDERIRRGLERLLVVDDRGQEQTMTLSNGKLSKL
ncbi:hypothetical protein VTN77DRAFT_8284 [Rasamsonia byssochlamydoides]|uniref:uncharacterized protein n=1 Tax=Rasamsonia byssochlamydoides TaxID=89139 RepID=UPI003742F605